jgi:hypothetical protein
MATPKDDKFSDKKPKSGGCATWRAQSASQAAEGKAEGEEGGKEGPQKREDSS